MPWPTSSRAQARPPRRSGSRTCSPRPGNSVLLVDADPSIIHFSTATLVHRHVVADLHVYLNHPQAYAQAASLAGPRASVIGACSHAGPGILWVHARPVRRPGEVRGTESPTFRPDISRVGPDRASAMSCHRSLPLAGGRCCCRHRCCQPPSAERMARRHQRVRGGARAPGEDAGSRSRLGLPALAVTALVFGPYGGRSSNLGCGLARLDLLRVVQL